MFSGRTHLLIRRCVVLELIVISTLNGVLFGMLLFLMASGLTVIFSMLGVLNFAHASFYMLGAFFGFQIARWFGFWPALLIAPVLAGADGAGQHRRDQQRGPEAEPAGDLEAEEGAEHVEAGMGEVQHAQHAEDH